MADKKVRSCLAEALADRRDHFLLPTPYSLLPTDYTMIRWLLKLIFFLVLAGLLYGLFLLYQEKTPEEKQQLRSAARGKVRQAGRLVERAGAKAVEKGKDIYRDSRKEAKD